ncbi:hypothetical protein G8E10_04020 [Rhizobiaceae bacterium CRRU44]|uniref:Uncharacterized protein n=1 Tax=Ferranicluibacter rubi TaxID=2715133 RepID=A0AA43ZBR4_9HYPH|nr:hypothetical protein [Ferranicluibacter rubi]NHT74919.1 hypothetical protein [Ferranicluibacter rubi]
MHQISLGLSLDRGGASAFAGMMALTAKNGSVLTDSAGDTLTGRAAWASAAGIVLTTTAQIGLTGTEA